MGLMDGVIILRILVGILAGPFVLFSFRDKIMFLISVVVVGVRNIDLLLGV